MYRMRALEGEVVTFEFLENDSGENESEVPVKEIVVDDGSTDYRIKVNIEIINRVKQKRADSSPSDCSDESMSGASKTIVQNVPPWQKMMKFGKHSISGAANCVTDLPWGMGD
ncbi:hypothetical protein GJ496_006384 [Pomphorhynchus laevis]|nr:hypothetical protein GJ496_006384 [Pomphorhynchus laevis]